MGSSGFAWGCVMLVLLGAGCGDADARLERTDDSSNARGPAMFESSDIEIERAGFEQRAREVQIEMEGDDMTIRVTLELCHLDEDTTWPIVNGDIWEATCAGSDLHYAEDPDSGEILSFDARTWSAREGTIDVRMTDEGAELTVDVDLGSTSSGTWFSQPMGTDAEGAFHLAGVVLLDYLGPSDSD